METQIKNTTKFREVEKLSIFYIVFDGNEFIKTDKFFGKVILEQQKMKERQKYFNEWYYRNEWGAWKTIWKALKIKYEKH